MQDIAKYPHFIPDKPSGEDCFEGHSQEKLAHEVCNYVKKLDAPPDINAKPDEKIYSNMPRIIGLEGGWGSGKSNVVSLIGKELDTVGYYTFTYDAWGHQEDLQRRSILEVLTGELIQEKILEGKVKIKMRNGKLHEASWEDQLSLLLSNKTTTIRKSTPLLTWAALGGIVVALLFAVLSHVTEVWGSQDVHPTWFWILDLIPVLLAIILAICYWCRHKSFKGALQMVAYNNNDTIDEEYTSSEEPSVAEFKNWMRAVSDYLGKSKRKYKRLIIVFDNMDRLPSEKVMQLWSSIYTFFAGGEFEHIWTIIPYDYEHLCQAIYGNEGCGRIDENNTERIKLFISKTFPITYHVPQPVITDYRKLFNTYFDKAFGPNIHDKEHICQVFMHLQDEPNPRNVIKFVNELVAMRLQWGDNKYRLQNQALYILKKDFLFYSGKRLETQLLSENLFEKVAPFYPEQDKVRAELCQYAYVLEDERLASETPLRNELKRRLKSGEPLVEYVEKDNFMSVFEKELADTDYSSLDSTVKSMVSLDDVKLSTELKPRIQDKWDFLANLKSSSQYNSHICDETLTILIKHATPKRVIAMSRSFALGMQRIKVTDGASYFQAQHKLQQILQETQIEYDDGDWYKPVLCEPEQFVQYVCEAKEEYAHYGLIADNKALNDYLLSGAVSGNDQVTTVVDYIKDDKSYDLTALNKALSKAIAEDTIKQNIHVSAYVHRVLDKEKGLLKVRFSKETVSSYLQENQAPWADNQPTGFEDVIAMTLAYGNDISQIDDSLIPRISDCIGRYMYYTGVLKNTGIDGSAFRKLNIYFIENLKGGSLDTKYVARHLQEIQNDLGIDEGLLLKQFNRWDAIDWGEIKEGNEYVDDVKNYVHHTFFRAYLDNPGKFSDSIIALGTSTLSLQNPGFLAVQQQVQQGYNRQITVMKIEDYWKDFVVTYLGTDYLKEAGETLTNEAVTMLQWLYDRNETKEPTLLDAILQKPEETTLKSYLHTMMNNNFVKTDISKEKFLYFGKLLPMLGSDMDANTARGLMQHFIKPVSNDADCAAIIVTNKEFYLSVMRHDTAIAAPIVKDMIGLDAYTTMEDELQKMMPKDEKEEHKE